ncbi:MAG: AzlD domain-containing protein [Raoultibacter sp.]|jgi:branched-subunit amino acid transport protein
MTWTEFFIVFACCSLTILACRVIPLFLLKGKELPERVRDALGFIPPAAFAALVANDLFSPGMFEGGIAQSLAPLLAAAAVVIVAVKTKSLIWCAVVGVLAYALFAVLFSF